METGRNSSRRVVRTTLHRGVKFDYEQLAWISPTGRPLERQSVRHPGAVVIVPILEVPGAAPDVLLVRNFRPSVERTLLEFPAGTRERGEPEHETAARELEEETGYSAATLTPLGRFHTTPGLTDEMMWAFVATGLTPVGQRLEPDEELTVRRATLAELWTWVDSGELADGKSLAALLLATRRGLLPGAPSRSGVPTDFSETNSREPESSR